jgi:hypothetical protein
MAIGAITALIGVGAFLVAGPVPSLLIGLVTGAALVVATMPPLLFVAALRNSRWFSSRGSLAAIAVAVSFAWELLLVVLLIVLVPDRNRAGIPSLLAGALVLGVGTGLCCSLLIHRERDAARVSSFLPLAVLFVSTLIAGLATAGAAGVGPLAGCTPIPPRVLPSGAPPGPGRIEVHGSLVAIWGSGQDLVEQYVDYGLVTEFDTRLADVRVRGQPASVYRTQGPPSSLLLVWAEGGCDYSVRFAQEKTVEEIAVFAPQY